MKQYINPEKCKTYKGKKKAIQKLINEALFILDCFGIPVNGTPRRLERMAIAFLACGDMRISNHFKQAKDLNSGYSLKTREIIEFINSHFGEDISSGSYDDIRRKDLKLLIVGDIILPSSPNSATNDSTRGYGVNPFYANLIRTYGKPQWKADVTKALVGIEPIREKLKRRREIKKVSVMLPSGKKLDFSPGEHNDLQKAIIEEFLPRYGYGANVLYVGDTSRKYLHLDEKKLRELAFFELSHQELPDIISYSASKKWIFLIEAVHSSGPIDEVRLLQLKKLTESCKAEIVYITAFLDRKTFRQFMAKIAWETEVWIADSPVHFNGGKFLGPYHS